MENKMENKMENEMEATIMGLYRDYIRVILGLPAAWTPKVCKIMVFMAIIMGLGLLFYILLGFRWYL